MSGPVALDGEKEHPFCPDLEAIAVPDDCRKLRKDVHGAVEHGIQVIERTLDSGQVELSEFALESMGPALERDADEAQAVRLRLLRVATSDWKKREEAAGGPGSLIDPEHPFIKGCAEAAARAQDPMPF